MLDRLIAVMFTSKCLLLLAITFESCQLERQHMAVTKNCNTTIRIAMGFVGDYLTGEWRSAYGSATEVMHIAETTCSKYDKLVNTEKRSGIKNFTCVVSGPHLGHLEGEFVLQFESDEVDVITLTQEGLEKRNQEETGYDIADLQLKVLNAPT
ncbi:unnamed protein product [Dicrocoelium dendriticum]|nr:unnamed protein product [Dicrocoelium dendriticum]